MFQIISKYLYLNNVRSISKNLALIICIFITAAAMVLEFIYGYFSHSMMLISDAFHMLTHALSLMLTLVTRIIAKRVNNRKVELAAVIINGITLFYFGLYIMYESGLRLLSPEEIDINYTLAIAIIGLFVNIGTAVILNQAGIEDLNTKSAFVHMISDTLSSISIVIGSIVIHYTNWFIIDALLSIIVSILVIKWAIDLLWNAAIEFNLVGKRSYL